MQAIAPWNPLPSNVYYQMDRLTGKQPRSRLAPLRARLLPPTVVYHTLFNKRVSLSRSDTTSKSIAKLMVRAAEEVCTTKEVVETPPVQVPPVTEPARCTEVLLTGSHIFKEGDATSLQFSFSKTRRPCNFPFLIL